VNLKELDEEFSLVGGDLSIKWLSVIAVSKHTMCIIWFCIPSKCITPIRIFISVLTSKNYKSLESYSALDDDQGDRDEIVPCCLDGLLEEQEDQHWHQDNGHCDQDHGYPYGNPTIPNDEEEALHVKCTFWVWYIPWACNHYWGQ
jgi:hypothetical protein